jgi:hypothetical protein
LPWLPWNINNPNPQFSNAHLTILKLNNFKKIEAMGLKIIASLQIYAPPAVPISILYLWVLYGSCCKQELFL